MIKNLKELINQNEEIKNSLQECSDEVLLANQGVILTALDTENHKPGYKIALKFNKEENVIEWSWIPNSKETKDIMRMEEVASKYTYKLKGALSSNYLLHLNDVNWTENKRELSAVTIALMNKLRNKELPSKGFWLKGESGVGKTFYVQSLLNTITDLGYTVALANMRELKEKAQSNFNVYGNDVNVMEQIWDAKVLVIDNVGYERPTPWFKENILLPLLSHRVESGLLTIFVSTNSLARYKSILDYVSNITKLTDNKDKTQKEIDPQFQEDTNSRIMTRINQLIEREVEI